MTQCSFCPPANEEEWEEPETTRTYSLLTPYSKPFGPRVVGEPTMIPVENYRLYDLFALETRLFPLILRLKKEFGLPGLGVRFNSIPLNGAMRVVIQLINGGTPVDRDKYQIEEEVLQSEVDKIIGFLPGYCLLISAHTPLLHEGKRIESGWIRSILPFLTFPSSYMTEVHTEGLYVHMTGKSDYVNEYNVLYLRTRRVLYTLYLRGTMALSPTLNRTLIQDWSLVPLPLTNPEALAPFYSAPEAEVGRGGRGITTHGEITYEDREEEKELQVLVSLENPEVRDQRLYVPTWFDSRFAPDRVLFLQSLLMRTSFPEIRIPVGGNLVRRHRIATLLQEKGYSHFEFHREYLYLFLQTLQEVSEACDLIFNLPIGIGTITSTIPSYRTPVPATLAALLPSVQKVQYRTTDYNLRPSVLSLLAPDDPLREEEKIRRGETLPSYST